jgi:RNA recognition motif-containing protein
MASRFIWMPKAVHTQIAHSKANRLKNIYVGNLGFNISEDALRQLFAAFGPLNLGQDYQLEQRICRTDQMPPVFFKTAVPERPSRRREPWER